MVVSASETSVSTSLTLRDSKFDCYKLTALLNTVSNMKSILLASNFLIVKHVLQNLCEIVTRSGKELKFVENKTVEDYFETTYLKLFQKFTRSPSKNLRYKYAQAKLTEVV